MAKRDTQLDLWSYTEAQALQDEPLTGDIFLETQPGPFPGSSLASIILTAVLVPCQSNRVLAEEQALDWLYKEQITYIGPPGVWEDHPTLAKRGWAIRGYERLVYRCIASGVLAGQVRVVFEFVRSMGDLKKRDNDDDEDLGDY